MKVWVFAAIECIVGHYLGNEHSKNFREESLLADGPIQGWLG